MYKGKTKVNKRPTRHPPDRDYFNLALVVFDGETRQDMGKKKICKYNKQLKNQISKEDFDYVVFSE